MQNGLNGKCRTEEISFYTSRMKILWKSFELKNVEAQKIYRVYSRRIEWKSFQLFLGFLSFFQFTWRIVPIILQFFVSISLGIQFVWSPAPENAKISINDFNVFINDGISISFPRSNVKRNVIESNKTKTAFYWYWLYGVRITDHSYKGKLKNG